MRPVVSGEREFIEGSIDFMCGLGVIIRIGSGEIPEAWLEEVDVAIRGRGPDGAGRSRDGVTLPGGRSCHVAMVHRRLAVIDPDGGHQPMVHAPQGADDPQRAAIVFNGCLAGHAALRTQLEAEGTKFRSDHSDTEVVLHAVRHWGERAANRLQGMQAWAVWQAEPARIHFGRDPFGEKPLWVAGRERPDGERLLVAASMPAVVGSIAQRFGGRAARDAHELAAMMQPLQVGGLGGLGSSAPTRTSDGDDDAGRSGAPSAVRPEDAGSMADGWLDRYLALGYTGREAAAGTFAWPTSSLVPRAGREASSAPDDPDAPGPVPTTESALLDWIDEALAAAVECRLESDVPLGCFLSGGVDSSLVAHHARRALGRLRTFAVRMPDPRFDESEHAAAAAQAIGSDHCTLDAVAETSAAEDFVALIEAAGAPIADSSILPASWVSRAAREHVTACLGGDGGDELFLGYDRYRAAPLIARAAGGGPAGLLRWLPEGLGRGAGRHPRGRLRRAGRVGEMARAAREEGLLAMERVISRPLHRRLRPGRTDVGAALATHATAASAAFGFPSDAGRVADAADPADAMRRLDISNYLPGDLLVKMDVASMHHALEVRSPMLDRRLARRALAIPTEWHVGPISGGVHRRTKSLLRTLAARVIGPPAHRPKQGFAIPVDAWFRSNTGGLGTLLGDALGRQDPFGGLDVDPSAARAIHRAHLDGRRDHGMALFTLLGLAVWAERFPELAAEG